MKFFPSWIAAVIGLLASSTASAYRAPDYQELTTQYGVLKASELALHTSIYALTFDDKPLGTVEAEGLRMYRVTAPSNNAAYVIVDKSLSGLHCLHEFSLVKVTSATEVKLSESFGNCMELQGAKLSEGGVKVFLQSPFIEGKQSENEEWTWEADVLREASAPPPSASGEYLQYINGKYGFSIDYPSSFISHGDSDAGDGLVFTSPTNDATLIATSTYCQENVYSPAKFVADYKQNEKAGRLTISYSRLTKKFAVISGTKGARIFYDKLISDGTSCAKFSFEYERSRKDQYDPMIARIASSLTLEPQ
jgi:hypothetical protein